MAYYDCLMAMDAELQMFYHVVFDSYFDLDHYY